MNEGYLSVSHHHQLYYRCWGDKSGTPILFLHGGPGLGCSSSDERFFDPQRHYVIFLDQRGSGKSRYEDLFAGNKPMHLVEDLVLLLDHLGIQKVWLFGGSWGAALSTLFGIYHKNRVEGMILRGFFPANEFCTHHFTEGGTQSFFPEAWHRFVSMVPDDERTNVAGYYYEMLQSEDETLVARYNFEWAFYGFQLSRMESAINEDDLRAHVDGYLNSARLQSWYSIHNCFLPADFIYQNLSNLKELPVYIVQGRYDMVCPPEFSWRLHRLLPNSKYFCVNAGHASSEPAIEKQLKKILGIV